MGRFSDPYTPDEYVYECVNCGARSTARTRQGRCVKCNGELQNLSVPRD